MSDDAPGTECIMHLNTVLSLSMRDRQTIADILADFRVDELDDKLALALDSTENLLVEAAASASQRFPTEGRFFQETCFNRLQALHFRVKSAKNQGNQAIADARDEHFKLKNIPRLHFVWELDEDIEECVKELRQVASEAKNYLPE